MKLIVISSLNCLQASTQFLIFIYNFFSFRERGGFSPNLAETLRIKLSDWLKPDPQKDSWKMTLSKIIQEDSLAMNMTQRVSLTAYLSKGRDIDLKNIKTCERTIRWCTIGDMETNKCKWIARAAVTLGIEPRISCVRSKSVFECMRKINEQQADVITIDSNYGYVARK